MDLEAILQQEVSLLRDILSNLVLAEKMLDKSDVIQYQIHIETHNEMQKEIRELRKKKLPLQKQCFSKEDDLVYQQQIRQLKEKIRDQKKSNNFKLSQIREIPKGYPFLAKEQKKKLLLLEDEPS